MADICPQSAVKLNHSFGSIGEISVVASVFAGEPASAEVKIVWKPSLKMATYKRGALLRAPLIQSLSCFDRGMSMGKLGFKVPILGKIR